MAAVEKLVVAVAWRIEAQGRDAIGWVEGGDEHDPFAAAMEDAEEGRLPVVVAAEADDELGVCGEAPPPAAHRGNAWERGGLWREADEDLVEEIVVFKRGRWRCWRAAAAATDHSGGWRCGLGRIPFLLYGFESCQTKYPKENA